MRGIPMGPQPPPLTKKSTCGTTHKAWHLEKVGGDRIMALPAASSSPILGHSEAGSGGRAQHKTALPAPLTYSPQRAQLLPQAICSLR